jgi:hypothetical protein
MKKAGLCEGERMPDAAYWKFEKAFLKEFFRHDAWFSRTLIKNSDKALLVKGRIVWPPNVIEIAHSKMRRYLIKNKKVPNAEAADKIIAKKIDGMGRMLKRIRKRRIKTRYHGQKKLDHEMNVLLARADHLSDFKEGVVAGFLADLEALIQKGGH